MIKFFSFLFICCSVFPNSLQEKFKKEVILWPKYSPINNLLYQNVKQLKSFSVEPKIPKIIHQIWLGGPVPEKFNEAMQSWKLHHPEWTYKLWTDKDIKPFKMVNKDLFKMAPNYGMQADLLCMEILNRYGGFYVDIDQYCIKPHDIFHHVCSFYIGSENKKGNCNNNVIGVSKSNLFIKNWITKVRGNFKNRNLVKRGKFKDGPETTFMLTGPKFLTKQIKTNRYKDCLVLDKHFFNSLNPQHRSHIDISSVKEELKPYSYSAHFHTCSWFNPT